MADMATSQYDPCQVEPGKLFVGGLSWNTRKESFTKYFAQFGEIQEAIVIMQQEKPSYFQNDTTKQEKPKNRGFGFVKFVDPAVADKVLEIKDHIIDDKRVDPKRATKGSKYKVFVGGIPGDSDNCDLRRMMERFGEISEEEGSVEIKKLDGMNGSKNRGFGFVTFKHKESMEAACRTQYVPMGGKNGIAKQVEIKEAVNPNKSGPKSKPYQPMSGQYPYPQVHPGYQYDYNYPASASQGYPSGNPSYAGSSYSMYGNGSSQQQMSSGYDHSYPGYSSNGHGHTDQGYYYQQYPQGAQNGGSWRGQPQQSTGYAYGGQHPAVRQ